MTSRWEDYVLARDGEVSRLWAEAAQGRRTVYVLGEGFDPRALTGIERLVTEGAAKDLCVLSLPLAAPGGQSERAQIAAANRQRLEALVAGAGANHVALQYPDHLERRRSLGRLLFQQLLREPSFREAEHIIVDISALPTGVYFALIAGVLDRNARREFDGELQVVVAENPMLDMLIEGEGVETPETIARFTFDVELDPRSERPLIVWAPILGEGSRAQLEALHQNLVPEEICPVLPFPAANPRRADDLLLELREVLQDTLQVEPGNFIYADESNPFDLYRGLVRLHDRYRSALKPLGEAEVVVSTHSSKTLSLGALLAAYEHSMPVMNAEPEHYNFDVQRATEDILNKTRLACIWLVGIPNRTAAK